MDIGVREFKRLLSDCLERASRGEIIRITDRGQPRAVLGPIAEEVDVQRGVREGWIRSGDGSRPCPVQGHKSLRSSAMMLHDDRGI